MPIELSESAQTVVVLLAAVASRSSGNGSLQCSRVRHRQGREQVASLIVSFARSSDTEFCCANYSIPESFILPGKRYITRLSEGTDYLSKQVLPDEL